MDSIKKLQDIFSKFPTIGQRAAGRFVFYIIKQSKEEIDELLNTIREIRNKIKFCSFCFNPYGDETILCPICQNPIRNRQLLCVVEKESDLTSIENSKRYKGIYFILGGTFHLRKNNMDKLRIKELTERIKDPNKFGLGGVDFKEIIIALNPTPEGKSISILVEKALKEIPSASLLKITHLAKGLPVGGELEYADEETLESAFEGRR